MSDVVPTEPPSRVRRAYASAATRGAAVGERGRLWIENQEPSSRTGATIGWVRRYQAADGQLYALLLAAYVFLTVLPLLLVETSYLYEDPGALADRLQRRLGLDPATSSLLGTVLAGTSGHKLSAALIAVFYLCFFGLGFGRALQITHARSWGMDLRKSVVADQLRYLEVLGGLSVLTLVYAVETKALRGHPGWIPAVLDLVWVAVLVGFFVWAPRLLLHHRVAARDILPGAVFAVAGFVCLRIISGFLLRRWLEWYSKTYGALGIVMALFFWIVLFATVMVLAAALSPALAARRDARLAG